MRANDHGTRRPRAGSVDGGPTMTIGRRIMIVCVVFLTALVCVANARFLIFGPMTSSCLTGVAPLPIIYLAHRSKSLSSLELAVLYSVIVVVQLILLPGKAVP